MDVRTKALKARRRRLRTPGMKRMEVTLREQDAALIRRLAGELRRSDANAQRLRTTLHGALVRNPGTNIAEDLYDPVIAGPEFDEVFRDIEQFRHLTRAHS